MRRSVCCAVLLLLSAAALTAQSRSAQLLALARTHIAAQRWDSADAELSEALETAPYIMDSAWTYVWRGVLEYQQGRQQLARVSFRRAFTLYPDPGIRGLDTISTGLATLFDREFRAHRTYSTWDLDQPARWITQPTFFGRTSGEAIVRVVVDTSGHVDERTIEILTIPDSGLVAPLKQMIAGVAFQPARIGGKPVRSVVAYRIGIAP
jgi:tetratricopeptide (TPR) repeat protein